MSEAQTATFAEHIQELRKRLMWTVLFLVAGAFLGYFLRDLLIALMQNPLHERLYYTTPGGAFGFIVKVCTVFGFIVALPMVIYQLFAFFAPLIGNRTRRSFFLYVVASFVLAALGILFAYFVSLPAALKFLVNFGNESNIESLITANEYFNFVLTYIAGFAALFQVPLIVLFIDKLKPMPPVKLLGATKFVILGSFIISAIITPTPDPFNQALMAVPIILLYLFSVGIVAARSLGGRSEIVGKGIASQSVALPILRADLSSVSAEVFKSVPIVSGHDDKPVQVVKRVSLAPQMRQAPPRIVTSKSRIAPPRPRIISDFMVVPSRTTLTS